MNRVLHIQNNPFIKWTGIFSKHKGKCVYSEQMIVKKSLAGAASTLSQLFPPKEEFQHRHIGPRESDQTAMLDFLGYKVSILKQ